jgi:hypothetical protein
MDSFATQIQAMVKKIQSFLAMMMTYATPAGIARLEKMLLTFASKGLTKLVGVAMAKITPMMEKAMPELRTVINEAAYGAGRALGAEIAGAVVVPFTKSLTGPLGNVAATIFHNPAAKTLVDSAAPSIGAMVGNKSETYIENIVGTEAEKYADIALKDAETYVATKAAGVAATIPVNAAAPAAKASLADTTLEGQEMHHDAATYEGLGLSLLDLQDSESEEFGGPVWNTVMLVLKAIQNLIPTATKAVMFANVEVAKAEKVMDSTFAIFEVKGVQIFNSISGVWTMVWSMYFFVFLPLAAFLLYYAFWASGWFGGPQPFSGEEIQPPATIYDRLLSVACCCCTCISGCHDHTLCFWSIIIVMQIVVLLFFVISIIMCLIAGIQTFVVAGCSQIYVLASGTACDGVLMKLVDWLATFFIDQPGDIIAGKCHATELTTCELIAGKMSEGAMLTTVFSFLAALLCLQMILDSATLHEMAKYRRIAATKRD